MGENSYLTFLEYKSRFQHSLAVGATHFQGNCYLFIFKSQPKGTVGVCISIQLQNKRSTAQSYGRLGGIIPKRHRQ